MYNIDTSTGDIRVYRNGEYQGIYDTVLRAVIWRSPCNICNEYTIVKPIVTSDAHITNSVYNSLLHTIVYTQCDI